MPGAVWKKMWLLFTVVWVTVAVLNVATILAFADEVEYRKALVPLAFGVIVPAAAYLLGWGWEKISIWRGRQPPAK